VILGVIGPCEIIIKKENNSNNATPADVKSSSSSLRTISTTITLQSSNQFPNLINPATLLSHPTYSYGFYAGSETGSNSQLYHIIPSVNPSDSPKITTINVGGSSPCNLALSPNLKWLVVANYLHGSVSVIRVNTTSGVPDANPTTVYQLEGKIGPRTDRQEHPHAHFVLVEASGETDLARITVADLGCDLLHVLRLNENDGTIEFISNCVFPPATGPRHITRLDSRYIYIYNIK